MRAKAQLEVRLSEIRQAINTETIEAEEVETLHNEYKETEKELRAAIKREELLANTYDNAMNSTPETPEEKELTGIKDRALVANYLSAIERGIEVQGAERELRAAMYDGREPTIVGWEKDKSIPLSLLLSDPLETRADTATTISADRANVTTHEIMSRVFARTDTAFLGGNFMSVPAGTQRYPYVSSGPSLTLVNEGVAVDAAAAGITTETSDPREATLAYLIGNTTMLRFNPGVLEAAIRADAQASIADQLDTWAINGQVATTDPAAAVLNGLVQDLTAPSPAASSQITVSAFLAFLSGRIDGVYAYTSDDVRIMMRPEPFRYLEYLALAQGNNAERYVKDLMAGRWRASNRLTAPASGVSNAITYAPMNDRMEWKVPIWEDVQVIVDPYTNANARQVRFTFAMAFNVLVLRNNPWTLVSIKHTS